MNARWAAAAGALLGAASFAADLTSGDLRLALQFLASTGFAWGCTAFVAAFLTRTRWAAIAAAIAVLVVATAAYYALDVLVYRLPAAFLPGVLTAMAYWTFLAVVGGALLGLLAHTVRGEGGARAALAGGLACGLLSGAGIAILLALYQAGDDTTARVADGALQAAGGVLVAVWTFSRRNGPRPWLGFAAAAVVACAGGAAAWTAVESVPVIGF